LRSAVCFVKKIDVVECEHGVMIEVYRQICLLTPGRFGEADFFRPKARHAVRVAAVYWWFYWFVLTCFKSGRSADTTRPCIYP